MRIIWVILSFFILKPQSTAQVDWLCPCEFRQELEIAENSGSTLTDFQIRLDVTHQTGMASDFSDLRFTSTDGMTLLDYWVEYHVAGTSAVVWVELDQLTANTTQDFYMYYGSCGGSLSDAAATMVFYDDLNNLNGWSSIGNNSIVSTNFNGETVILKQTNCDPSGGWKSIGTSMSSFRLVAREYRSSNGPTGCGLDRYGLEANNFNGYSLRRNARTSNNGDFGYERRTNGIGTNANLTTASQPWNNWYRTELSRCGNGSNNISATLRSDGMGVISTVTGSDNAYSTFQRVVIRGGRNYYMDYMAVAKMVCDLPSVALGELADCPNVTVTNVVHDYCEDDQGAVTIMVENGTPPYDVSWTPTIGIPASPQLINTDGGQLTIGGLSAGTTLSITVVDANGCEF